MIFPYFPNFYFPLFSFSIFLLERVRIEINIETKPTNLNPQSSLQSGDPSTDNLADNNLVNEQF